MRAGLYEARSLDNGLIAYVFVEGSSTRMAVALRMIRDSPRSREVRSWAKWALAVPSDVEES